MQCQNFCRLFCATNLGRARDCNWINVIAWINIVFGLVCGFVLISEITAELSIPSTASPHSPGIWSFILLKLFYLLGSGVKFGMGLLLLIGNSQKNRRMITIWLIVTVILLLVEMMAVTPAVVIFLKRIDLIGVLGWELPWWISTLISLYVVNQHRNKLANDKMYQNNGNGNFHDVELDCNNRADSQMLPLPRSRSSSISTSISASVISNYSNKEQLETSQVSVCL